jgi:hypothetical protein
MNAAKQQLSLEQQLAARRAKKLKKVEHDNAKELEAAHTHVNQPGSDSQAMKQSAASIEEEKRKLEEQFAQKQAEELEALRATMEMEKQKMVAEEKAKLDHALQAATVQDLGNDERRKMIEQAEANMKKLEGYMDKEKMRQEDELKAQLQERMRKKMERVKAQHERKEQQENLEKQKLQELAKFEEEQEAERKKEEERVKMEIDAEREREIARMQQEIDAELERTQMEERQKMEQLAQVVGDAAAREALLKDADDKIQAMQERASLEKVRQEQLLQEKLAKKRAKKQAELQRKQEEQLQKKMLEDMEQINAQMDQARYDEAMMQLRRQHEQEMRDMLEAHTRETASTMEPLEQEMAARAKSVMPELLPPAPNVAEIEEKLNAKHKKMRADLEKRHRDELDALQSMDPSSVAGEAALQETLQEDEEEQEGRNAAAAKAAAAEFTKKLEAEKAKFEEEIRAAVEAQETHKRELLAKQEEERRRLEEEMRRDTEAFEEKMKAEQERKLKALEEKKKQMEEDMSKRAEHSTQEERKMLIDLHEQKLSQMEQVCPRFKALCRFFSSMSLRRIRATRALCTARVRVAASVLCTWCMARASCILRGVSCVACENLCSRQLRVRSCWCTQLWCC